MPGALELEAVTDLVRRAREGSVELLAAVGGEPLLVVDLDTGDPGSLELFPTFPGVVVGIGGPSMASDALGGVDVVLTATEDAPTPWVGVPDPEAAAAELAARASRSPLAAVTLAQLLRGAGRVDGSRPRELGQDLISESLAYSALQAGPEFAAWVAARGVRPPRRPDGPAVVVERSGARLDVTLDRPRVHNAYNTVMRDQLCEALSLACADRSIGEVHLHGAGPDFCSGGDLDEFGTLADPASAHLLRTARSAARLLGAVGARVTAHLHGACVGAGIELPALAGRVLAAPGTWMQLPELSMGLIPGAGGTASLPRRIGRHRTAWMALSGTAVDVSTALGWGLVDEIAA